MNLTDNIKNMFKQGQQSKYIASMPMCMAQPLNGTNVRFWTKSTMEKANAKTTIEMSIIGYYKDGYFMNNADRWSDNEIFSWSKIK